MKLLTKIKRRFKAHWIRNAIFLILSLFAILGGIVALWATTIEIPDLSSFNDRRVEQSTKIFDKTGKVLLYDIHANAKRTLVTSENISDNVKKATVAIEDDQFYSHIGFRPTSIIRAFLKNLTSGGLAQGGSTITQQVIKNTVLTTDKTFTRKIKEIILALKLEKALTKDQILTTYLNETPYGGNIYGIEEASRQFFGKTAKEVDLAEAAYLAALPQAPSYFSPFGKHKDKLDDRQKLVLSRMLETKVITQKEYDEAKKEVVKFETKAEGNIRAPHFSMMVRDYLIDKYGEDKLMNSGLKVTTTLDYDLQQKAEKIVTDYSKSLEENFNASNTAMIAIDPKKGDILMLVGSKDYFDQSIDGNVNIVTALRQPGSTFKPFVYATAWSKGYTPETVLFDVETEFSSECKPDGTPKKEGDDPTKICYSPVNYDDIFEGPMQMRKALAQSRNIPAVKTLYLAGTYDSIKLARKMGIDSLGDPNRYGLTLVLGGGEVSLLQLTNAYGTFANEGDYIPSRYILKVEDSNGNILEEAKDAKPEKVLDTNIAREISDALSDKKIRLDSLNNLLGNVSQPLAVKTGTTNDYKDVWIVGYSPNIVVGAWAGKNDNTPMQRKVAGVIISPVWSAFMHEALKDKPVVSFKSPEKNPDDLKAVLRGVWQGGISYFIDKISKKVATEYTPDLAKQEVVFNGIHSILYWVDKDNPRGDIPKDPSKDSQFENWEYGVRNWAKQYMEENPSFKEAKSISVPEEKDDVHTAENTPSVKLVIKDKKESYIAKDSLELSIDGKFPNKIEKVEFYLNNVLLGKIYNEKDTLKINLSDILSTQENSELGVRIYDSLLNTAQDSVEIKISD